MGPCVSDAEVDSGTVSRVALTLVVVTCFSRTLQVSDAAFVAHSTRWVMGWLGLALQVVIVLKTRE